MSNGVRSENSVLPTRNQAVLIMLIEGQTLGTTHQSCVNLGFTHTTENTFIYLCLCEAGMF